MTTPGQIDYDGVPVADNLEAAMFPQVVSTGQLTALGLNGFGPLPTIAGVTHCVSSSPVGHDMGGSFVLTTDSTSITAGTMATVTFGTALAAAPVAVLISVAETSSGSLANVSTVYVASIATTGFTIANSASTTASKTYLATYIVIAS